LLPQKPFIFIIFVVALDPRRSKYINFCVTNCVTLARPYATIGGTEAT
jgi:hypothetical protein